MQPASPYAPAFTAPAAHLPSLFPSGLADEVVDGASDLFDWAAGAGVKPLTVGVAVCAPHRPDGEWWWYCLAWWFYVVLAYSVDDIVGC